MRKVDNIINKYLQEMVDNNEIVQNTDKEVDNYLKSPINAYLQEIADNEIVV